MRKRQPWWETALEVLGAGLLLAFFAYAWLQTWVNWAWRGLEWAWRAIAG
jgi:hypothetical protein